MYTRITVYILEKASSHQWYIGYTIDLKRRLVDHNSHKNKSTRSGKWRLMYAEYYLDKRDALGREKFLKSGSGHRFIRKQLSNYLKLN